MQDFEAFVLRGDVIASTVPRPACASEIPSHARRCAFCTSQVVPG